MNKDFNSTKTLAEISAELRNELTGDYYTIEELRRIYIHIPISEHFCFDNSSKSDLGSEKRMERRKYHRIINVK
jgi:hypothetical protein